MHSKWVKILGIILTVGPVMAQPCNTPGIPLNADSVILPIAQRVDVDSVRSMIQRLQDFGTRYYTTDSLQAARAWIGQEMTRRGADTVWEQPFTYNGTNQANVIARKQGLCPDNLRIILGAHYDSMTYSNPETSAPGADDNGSGVALLLEILRVIQDLPLQRTVDFVAFAAEEPGLIGSSEYAQQASASGDTFLFYLNADMIGGDADEVNDTIIVEVDQGNAQSGNDLPSQMWGDSLSLAYTLYTPLGVDIGPIYASDYMPLEAEGYTTFGVFEYHWNSTSHSAHDVIDSMDVPYATQVIQGVVALVVAAAGMDTTTLVAERKASSYPRLIMVNSAGRSLIFSTQVDKVWVLDAAGRVRFLAQRVHRLSLPPSLPQGIYSIRIQKDQTLWKSRIFIP